MSEYAYKGRPLYEVPDGSIKHLVEIRLYLPADHAAAVMGEAKVRHETTASCLRRLGLPND